MNIALPAIIIFVLLLPGFIVRSRFKRVERVSLDYSPFGQVVTEAVLWTCVLHALWLSLAYVLLGQRLQTDLAFSLMSADPAAQSHAIGLISKRDTWLATYFLSLLAFAFIAPALARAAIIRWRLDRSGSRLGQLLRFKQAPWYYLLTGADFSEAQKPDLIIMAAIVNAAGIATLYTGVLEDFYVDETGDLDRLVLSNVSRRQLASDKSFSDAGQELPDETRFYPIEGDYFVLRYREAITLNIQYVKLQEEDEEDTDSTATELPAY